MLKTAHKKKIYDEGLQFYCTRCSNCCRHESGFVFLSRQDVSRLSLAFDMPSGEFTKAFCRWVYAENGREQLSLREKSNFDCVFWAESVGCTVYQARPLQCQAFPFWSSVLQSIENWEAAAEDCPGIGQGVLHSVDTIEKWLSLRQNEPILFKDQRH